MLGLARDDIEGRRPSEALMARILADAYAHQPAAVVAALSAPRRGWRGAFGAAVAAVGGFRAVAGLGTAAVVGVFIGYADPPAAAWLAQGLSLAGSGTGSGDIDLLSADDLFLMGG